jgi:hypothetical protein
MPPDSFRADVLPNLFMHHAGVLADGRSTVRMRPVRLNAAIAVLFIIGSSCFVLGSIPAYVGTVGVVTDALTYVIGSIFFTAASFLQLMQAQTPSMTGGDGGQLNTPESVVMWRTLPHDRSWLAAITQFPGTILFNVSTLAALARNASVQQQDQHVWRPDVFGSTLFIVSSVFGLLAVGGSSSARRRLLPWWIAWLNMIGSILFMAAALAGYVLPSSGEVLNIRVDLAGTLLGALCFLIGAALMFPAWSSQARPGRAPRPSVPKEST